MIRHITNLINKKMCYVCVALGSFIILILMLLPLMKSGFFGDDVGNSFLVGSLQYSHQTLMQGLQDEIKNMIYRGRFYPIAIINISFLFAFANNLILYKSLIILSLVINILLFGYFIWIATESKSLSLLSILITPIFFQFREFHDPIMGFSMHLQDVFLFIILSLIFLIIYFKKNEDKYLILSMVAYLLSMLTYELAMPFFILYFFIIYIYSPDRNLLNILKLVAPFLLLSLICILIPVVIRFYLGLQIVGGTDSSAYTPNINFTDFLILFGKQTFAAFPLSYLISRHLFQPTHNFLDIKHLFSPFSIIISVSYFLFCTFVFKNILEEINERKTKLFNVMHLSIIGMLLLILPSCLVSLSPRYQKEVYWGVGYLPVYVSYFGVAILSICFVYFTFTKISKYNKNIIFPILTLIALAISITGALTYASNEVVIENLNHGWLYPRLIIEDALANGLFKFVPEDSILLVDSSNPGWEQWWEQPGFYLMHSGVRLTSVEINGGYSKQYLSDKLINAAIVGSNKGIYSLKFSKSNKVFYLRYASQSREDGYVVLGGITDLLASNTSLNLATANNVYIYIRQPHDLNSAITTLVEGYWAKNNSHFYYEPFSFKESELKLTSSGKGWKLFSIPGDGRIIDVSSLKINPIWEQDVLIDSPKRNDIRMISGFWASEDWGGTQTCWLQADATLLVNSSENRTVTLSLNAQSFYRNRTLEVYAGDELLTKNAIPSDGFAEVEVPVHLVKGINALRLRVPEGCERPSNIKELNNIDGRCLSVAIQKIALSERKSDQFNYLKGFHGTENWSGTPTRWMQANATLLVNSSQDRTATLSLNAQSFYRNRTLEITTGDEPAARVAVPTSFINVSMPIHLAKGANTVHLRVPEGCEMPSDIKKLNSLDGRCLSVAIRNLDVS